MVALPVFCSLAFMDVLLSSCYSSLLIIAAFILICIVSSFLLLGTYAIRLRAHGVKVVAFVKKLVPLLRENSAIVSSIDAAPYNVRYCARHYGMDRRRISRIMPVLAQINLDGNCFILTLVAMLNVFMFGVQLNWLNTTVIAALVLFLSLGAPNQPGSILIGTLIIISYLGSYGLVCMALYLEVFLGSLQNIINVASDVVTVAEEEGVKCEE